MFGLFGKKELENSSFNNLIVAVLAKASVASSPPSERELFLLVDEFLPQLKAKLNDSQINSVKHLAVLMEVKSVASELLAMARSVNIDIPKGETRSSMELIQALCRRGTLTDDDALKFLNRL